VLGLPADGTELLAALAMGRLRPSSGTVRLAGRDPWASPATRARIAALGPRPDLPDVERVADLVALVGRAGGWDSRRVLDEHQLGALAGRAMRSLSHGERRAVELALASSHPDPLLLLLFEPFRMGAGGLPRDLRERARRRAAAGACVLVIASEPEQVLSWVDRVYVLQGGFSSEASADATAQLRQLVVWVAGDRGGGARALAAALAEHEEIQAVGWQVEPAHERTSTSLAVVALRAADLDGAALCVARHAHRLGLDVRSVHSPAPTVAELAAAAARSRAMHPQGLDDAHG
jgi:ABC-type multidrug transport system ATPase subunit